MKVATVQFSEQEKKYLDAMCRLFYRVDEKAGNKHMAVAWGLTAGNLGKSLPLIETQMHLLSMAVDLSIKQGDKLHNETQDLAVRVKAAAILEVYSSIKTKLAGAVYTDLPMASIQKADKDGISTAKQTTSESSICQITEDLPGNDEG